MLKRLEIVVVFTFANRDAKYAFIDLFRWYLIKSDGFCNG
ncbi:hypothetical protein MARI151_60554 [Maribacter litoralis]|uniref:Uncharacterized protein n=1 Tax=Maribacter litoralis TaxID=2059726 RepID=A0A653XEZ7_9FLAO|nr:hypothetical protein MARI151_60554 [Maribacter litoralis]